MASELARARPPSAGSWLPAAGAEMALWLGWVITTGLWALRAPGEWWLPACASALMLACQLGLARSHVRQVLAIRLARRMALTSPHAGDAGPDSQQARQAEQVLQVRWDALPVPVWQLSRPFATQGGEQALDSPMVPLNWAGRRLWDRLTLQGRQQLKALAFGRDAATAAGASTQALSDASSSAAGMTPGPDADAARQWQVLETVQGEERFLVRTQALGCEGRHETLVLLVPLDHALDAQAQQAWQQLVHVLTHEIMNSLTPITSLSQTALELTRELASRSAEEATETGQSGTRAGPLAGRGVTDDAELVLALTTLVRRSQSLSSFVAEYRRLGECPAPRPEVFLLDALFQRLSVWVEPAWQARGGQASFRVRPTSLQLRADEGQLEQALINLLRNAAEATHQVLRPQVEVTAEMDDWGRLHLSVRDNGPGVPAGLAGRIFLPFFSTRAGPDSSVVRGIGLTVARQLVCGMGGQLRHVRPAAGGAAFVIIF